MHVCYTKVTSQATQYISACTNAGYKGYNTSQSQATLQATQYFIMHAKYKGYKPICTQVTRATSQLQATQ